MEALHRPLHTPDVLANALNNGGDRPLLHLQDGPTQTVDQVRDATSQYQQALASLETVFYGASAISPARLKEAIERIGPVFSQFYGQAEAPSPGR